MSSESSADSRSVLGSIKDNGDELVLTCGKCGKEGAIRKVSEVSVFVQGIGLFTSLDIASMSKHG